MIGLSISGILQPPQAALSQTDSDFVSDTISVGDSPVGIIYNSFNDRIYVANFGDGTISVIDPSTNEVVDVIDISPTLINLAFNPSNGIIYSTNRETVSVISGTTNDVIDTIDIPSPYGIAVHPPTGKVYVTDNSGSAVIVIDPVTNTISNTIEVPIGPISAGFNPINGLIYVASSGNDPTDVVSVINPLTDEVIDTIPVGDSPQGIAFNPTTAIST